MVSSRSMARSFSRGIYREAAKYERRKATHRRVQREAANRPESKRVETPNGAYWMSPIESRLYEAMCAEGLHPVPQFPVEGYIVDFAFPEFRLAIEADGAAYHEGAQRDHDRKRDWILKSRYGWTVKRFWGTTIFNKPANCAFVVKREVETRRRQSEERARQQQLARQERRDAILRPFRRIATLLSPHGRKKNP